MTNIQTLARILTFLLLLFNTAHAQNAKRQTVLWSVNRAILTNGASGGNWEEPNYKSTASIKASPDWAEMGRSYTFNDSVKGRFGRTWATGVATQDGLKVRVESILSVDSDTNGFNSAGSTYRMYPQFYLQKESNVKLDINVKSKIELKVKVDEKKKGGLFSSKAIASAASAASVGEGYKGSFVNVKELQVTSDFDKPEDSWQKEVDISEKMPVTAFTPYSLYDQKIWYGVDVMGFCAQYSQLLKSFAPGQVSSSIRAEGGEAYVHLVEEYTITVEQNSTPNSNPLIGVDFNRDGAIDYDKADKTSAAKPFNFWLNTDCEADEEQENPPTKVQDCADGVISSKRDLEDFTRLHIQAPAEFRPDGTWKCKLNFVGATGSPAIRLFPAASPGTEYLTNPDAATKQIRISSNLVVGSTPVEIPLSLFKSEGANKFRAALLFEAIKAGQGALQVTFTKAGKEQKAKNPVYLNLRPIQDFYDYYLLPAVDLNGVTTNYNHPSATAKDIAASQTSDYILFVHGWRMQEWKKQIFAETSFKRLWQRGYKGKFGFFSWPTDYTALNPLGIPIDEGNYNRSERRAWLSAVALHSLLVSLSGSSSQKVHVFGHSMGNVVTSEALLLEAQSPTPKKIAQTYVATQAATVAQAYDSRVGGSRDQLFHGFKIPNVYKSYPLTALPYFEHGGMRLSVGKMSNYFNERDYALNNWGWGQLLKKPESGAYSDLYDYGYDSTKTPGSPEVEYGFYRETRTGNPKQRIQLLFPDNRYEIFAHAAPAFSLPLGRQEMPIVAGLFSENINLEATPFNFTGDRADHSAQFNSDLMTRYPYWEQLMKSFGMNVSPPK